MPLKTKEVEDGLRGKGFEKQNKKHKTFRYVTKAGVYTSVYTHLSHGPSGKEIADGIIAKMAKQCKISNLEFKQLVSCVLSREVYENLLCKQSIL